MAKIYAQGTLNQLTGIGQTDEAIGNYVLRPDGLWFRPRPGFADLSITEQEAVSGFDGLEHIDTTDVRLYGLSTTEGAKPMLPFPFTARQLWDFNDATGDLVLEHFFRGEDTEEWIAQQSEDVQELARALMSKDAPEDGESVQPAGTKPIQRSAAQHAAILDAIRKLGHDPQRLPKNEPGKRGIKAAVRTALEGLNTIFPSRSTVFNKAWGRLLENGDIAYNP